jgi:hypothetical protein
MMHKPSVVVPLLFALALVHAQAQSQAPGADQSAAGADPSLQQLLSKFLILSINARVLPPDQQDDTPIWNAESSRLTLPGRAIKLRLDGDNVHIYLVCTPYMQADGEVLLLAQGQVWFVQPTDNENRYFSTYYAIPVSYGESVLFLPLGLSDAEAQQKNFFNIEVEITIRPYEQKE